MRRSRTSGHGDMLLGVSKSPTFATAGKRSSSKDSPPKTYGHFSVYDAGRMYIRESQTARNKESTLTKRDTTNENETGITTNENETGVTTPPTIHLILQGKGGSG